MSSLSEKILADTTEAQKARDAVRLGTLRLVRSEMKYKEIEKGSPLEDEDILQIMGSMVKKRREAAEMYRKGNREELAVAEETEIATLAGYLPKQLSEAEIAAIVTATVAEVGAAGMQDIGKVMGAVMPKVKGKSDGKIVAAQVRNVLQSL